MNYLVLFFIFFFTSVFLHKDEILNKEIVYSDNFYHYIIYPEIHKDEKKYFERDLIYSSIQNSAFKKIAFNSIVLKIFSLNDNIKAIGLIIVIISQLTVSFIFLYFISKICKLNNYISLLYTLFFCSFISNTDLFFFDLRRNIGFVFFMLTIYNFYFKNTLLFILFSTGYVFFYSASALFIVILIITYLFDLNKNKDYFIAILFIIFSLFIIFNYEQLIYFFISVKEGAIKAFEWKNYFKNKGFIENYLFNFNEYFRKYVYHFYLVSLFIFINLIIITNKKKKLSLNIIEKNDFILIFSALLSFYLAFILVSPGYASRQTIFVIPFMLILLFIKSNELSKSYYKTKILNYFVLFFSIFLFFSSKTDHFEKVNIKMMNFISNNTSKHSLIISHPSEKFIPYFTKRVVYIIEGSEKIICTAYIKNCSEVYRRYLNSLDFFYTNSLQKINLIIKREKIDYIIVDKKYYSKSYLETPKAYDKIRKLSYEKYLLNKEKKFKILELAEKYGTKIDDTIYFIDAKKIL